MQYWSPRRVCMFSLCVDDGFLWVSLTIQRHTGQLNETVVSVNMNMCVCHPCDGLAICPEGCPDYDPGKPPVS